MRISAEPGILFQFWHVVATLFAVFYLLILSDLRLEVTANNNSYILPFKSMQSGAYQSTLCERITWRMCLNTRFPDPHAQERF